MKSDRFLIKVAELYYRDGLSQQEIAKKLHTSRTSISRALIQARNEGYVQIRIQYPEQSDLGLERELEEKYGAWNDMGKSHAWICRTVVQG